MSIQLYIAMGYQQLKVWPKVRYSLSFRRPKLLRFPTMPRNLVICVTTGNNREFSALITDCTPDLHLTGGSQCFPLYIYEVAK